MNDTIAAIIHELKYFEDSAARKLYLEEHLKEIVDGILEIDDEVEQQIVIDKILNIFEHDRIKGTIKRIIEAALTNERFKETKSKMVKFTTADIKQLNPNKNGLITATTRNIEEVLLAAIRTHLIYDTMTAYPYFTSMDWEPLTAPLEVNGRQYHRYDETNQAMLKSVLNKHIFPNEISFVALDEAVLIVAQRNKVDFYQDYINGMPAWDGIDHSGWSIRYFGTTNDEWSIIWERMLMLSIMHRCFTPAGQLRYSYVFEGEQNIGKTEFCRRLVPDFWYASQSIPAAADSPIEFYRATYSKAIIEIPELGNLNKRTDSDLFKRINTERYSTFRRMHKDDVKDYPKRNVFIITTNETSYLKDHTGETRFLPIKSNNKQNEFFDLAGFSAELPQIYAQYRDMYAAGALPQLTKAEMENQKIITEERDLTKETLEYQIVEDYMSCGDKGDGSSVSNFDLAKQDGMWLDKLYEFVSDDSYRMTRDKAMVRSRGFGNALVKFGFVRIKKAAHIAGYGTKRVWAWPNTEFHKKNG